MSNLIVNPLGSKLQIAPSNYYLTPDMYVNLGITRPNVEWRFADGITFDKDGSVYHNHGKTLLSTGLTDGVAPSLVTSPIGWGKRALNFNRSTNYLQIADAAMLNITTQNFSIAAWVRNTNPASYQFVVGKGANTSTAQGYALYTNASNWLFDVSDGVDVVEVYTPITANAWSFVVVTVDAGASASIFLNGVFKQSASLAAVGSLTCPARPFTVGMRENGGSYYFPGDQAWIAFWDGVAVTTTEQLALYNAMNKGSLTTPRPPIWAL